MVKSIVVINVRKKLKNVKKRVFYPKNKQEAQLLLGDRATRKNAKDS